MKTNRQNLFRTSVLRFVATATLAVGGLVSTASALTYYWDGNGATPGGGLTAAAAGTWGGGSASLKWSTSATGAVATTDGAAITSSDAVAFTAYDAVTAGFENPTGGYTVTLGAPQSVSGIVFGPAVTSVGGTTTLALSGANTLTIGAGGITLNGSNGDPKIGTAVGTGSVILSANQTWTSNFNHAMTVNSNLAGDAVTGSRTLTLGFHNQFSSDILSVLSDGLAGGNLALNVDNSGGGFWNIAGNASTYTGKTTISRGILQVKLLADAGTASTLGAPAGADSIIGIGSSTFAGTLKYSNDTVASSSNRVVNLAGTTGGGIITNDSAVTGTLSLTGGVTNAGGGNKTLTLNGSNLGNNTLGTVSNAIDLSTTAVSKSGAGTWILSGNNTFTGGLAVSSGTLTFSAPANSFDGAIAVSGASSLVTFNGSNNFTKGMNITGGTVIVGAAGALGQDVTGNNIVVNGGNLQFNANSGFTNANRTINIQNGGIGIGPGGVLPPYTDSTPSGVILGLNLVGDAGITGITGGSFLGSFTGGTFTGASLTPGTGSTYRLGGGGGSLIIQNNVLVGATNLIVGTPTSGGSVTLSNGNTFTGTTTIQNGILNVSSLNKVVGGTASSSLGAPTSVATGTIALGLTTNAVTLNYTGAGETTDRVLAFSGTTGTVTLGNSGSGTINYSSAPTFTGTGARTIQLGATTNTKGGSLAGLADNGANKTSVSKAGLSNSTWVLTGNTYTGTTRIDGGVLELSLASLATSYINLDGDDQTHYGVLQTNGTLSRTIGTAAGNIRVGVNSGFAAKGGALTVELNAGAVLLWGTTANFLGTGTDRLVLGSTTADSQVEFKNPINLNTGDAFERRIYVEQGVGGDSALLSGVLSFGMTGGGTPVPAPTGIEKLGSGTLILSAANTYFGLTSVSGGKLLVTGSTSTGNVAVNSSGTLGGTGTIGGAITVNSSGTIAPGTSVGTLAASSSVNFTAGSSFAVELNAVTSDRLSVTGSLNITGATLNLTSLATPTAPVYVIASYGSLTGTTFVNVNGLPSGYELQLGYNGGTQIALVSSGPVTPFSAWASSKGLSGSDALPASDPDKDGVPNIIEFALSANPTDGASKGLAFSKLATVSSEPKVLTYTIAVLDTTPTSSVPSTFAAAGTRQTTTAQGITYTVEAANNLSDWGGPTVTEVTGTDAETIRADLPTPDSGWSYKTFRTDGSAPSDASDFIRVGVQ